MNHHLTVDSALQAKELGSFKAGGHFVPNKKQLKEKSKEGKNEYFGIKKLKDARTEKGLSKQGRKEAGLKMAETKKEFKISFRTLLSDVAKVLGWPEPIYSKASLGMNVANVSVVKGSDPP